MHKIKLQKKKEKGKYLCVIKATTSHHNLQSFTFNSFSIRASNLHLHCMLSEELTNSLNMNYLLHCSIKSVCQNRNSNHAIRCELVWRNKNHHWIIEMQQSFRILVGATGLYILRKMKWSWPQVKRSNSNLSGD